MPDTHFHPDALVRPEGIFERRMVFCPRLQEFLTEDLIVTCEECGDFAIFCCPCSPNSDVQRRSCHKYRLVFTDGACRDNGALGATSGVGLAVGTDSADSLSQLSIPITTKHDRDHKRTSQRAELLGALYGLRFLGLPSRIIEIEGEDPELKDNISCRKTGNPVWVIATDSEYVVKGMTEWLPQWKVRCTYTRKDSQNLSCTSGRGKSPFFLADIEVCSGTICSPTETPSQQILTYSSKSTKR